MDIGKIFHAFPVETKTTSWTGKYLYSDSIDTKHKRTKVPLYHDTVLNKVVRVPIVGILGGLTRVVLSIIHIIGHLLTALYTQNKGHLYHAGKGVCELTRGVIETLPIIGRIFANLYGGFWLMKMYHPDAPDALDKYFDCWANRDWTGYLVVVS